MGKMQEPRGIKQHDAGLRAATPRCSARPGSARLNGAAPREVSWLGSVLKAPGREGDNAFPSSALSSTRMKARPGE